MIGFLKDQIADDVEEGGVSRYLHILLLSLFYFHYRYKIILLKNII